jgi:hypothetical protein
MTAPILIKFIPLASVLQFSFRLMVIIGFCLAIIAGLAANYLSNLKPEKSLFICLGVILVIILDFWGANSFQMTGQPNENFINPPAAIDALKTLRYDSEYFLVFSPFTQSDYMYTGHYQMGFAWAGYRQGAGGVIHKEYTDTTNEFLSGNTSLAMEKMGYFGVKYFVLPCNDGLKPIEVYSNNYFCTYKNPHFTSLIVGDKNTPINFKIENGKITFLTSGNASSYLIKIFNFHRKAYINGLSIPISEAYPQYMAINVPQGNYEVELRYERTGLQIITLSISLLTLFALIYMRFKK